MNRFGFPGDTIAPESRGKVSWTPGAIHSGFSDASGWDSAHRRSCRDWAWR